MTCHGVRRVTNVRRVTHQGSEVRDKRKADDTPGSKAGDTNANRAYDEDMLCPDMF